MRKFFFFLFFFLFLLFPKSIYASQIIMDISSGRVLSSNDSHEKMLIASTTKIMTCILALENLDLNKKVKVGEEVLSMYGTNIYIEYGEVLTVKDLLYGLMLRSGNDAAEVLAITTSGSEEEFVKMMNDKAKKIGMSDTSFQNPHGLDDKTYNYSTAYDMALLSRYAYQNPVYREIISTKKYATKSSLKSYLWYNRMNLLNLYSNCIGGKNGYTPKAGKSLVSLAKNDDLILTIVSLDDPNIYDNHKKLYEEYFKKYKRYQIINHKTFYIDSSLIEDRDVYIKDDFYYPLTEEELDSISTYIHIDKSSHNNIVGEIDIKLNKDKIGSIVIYEKENKKKDGFFIFQFFKKLFR